MCNIFPKLEAKTLKNMEDMKQIFQNFHSRTKNVMVKMTLTLTWRYFVEVIYLYLKDTVMVLIKTKHNDNITTNCGTINLQYEKNDTF